jgi:hypothetical protein
MRVPRKIERRFMEPAIEFVKSTDLWNEADLPKEVDCGSIKIFRRGFAFALADVMLRYGYLMILDPGEGSETVHAGLTTLHRQGVPLWLGSGFTKTQYASHCHFDPASRSNSEQQMTPTRSLCCMAVHQRAISSSDNFEFLTA